jgi:hypothetical protein
MEDLALIHELLYGACDILDRYLRVNTMLVEEINTIRAEPLERPLDRKFDVIRLAVETRAPFTSLEIDVPAEL